MSYEGTGLDRMEVLTNEMAGNLISLATRIQAFTLDIANLTEQATTLPRDSIKIRFQRLLDEVEKHLQYFRSAQNENRQQFSQALSVFESDLSHLLSMPHVKSTSLTLPVRQFIGTASVVDNQLTDLQASIHRFLVVAEQALIQHKLLVSYNESIIGIAAELRQMLPLYERVRWLLKKGTIASANFI